MSLRNLIAAAALMLGTNTAISQEKPEVKIEVKQQIPYKIPVLIVKYFPVTADGQNIDIKVTSNVGGKLEDVRKKCDKQTNELIAALEQGSRFRPYKNDKAPASLDYVILDTKEFLEALPKSEKIYSKAKMPDYKQVMEKINIKDWVENKGIKEVWIWAYHSPDSGLWESNMSSPLGDISNSDRDPKDLPVLNKTYTVYHYNYQRGTSEAMENHMHQIESVLRHVGGDLWKTFEGKKGEWRCGNAHFPPNGKKDYDWGNKEIVMSDIEDWKPEGFGEKKPLNSDKWESNSLKWFVYWQQSIPGHENGLEYKNKKLTNWWTFIGDYDNARKENIRLAEK